MIVLAVCALRLLQTSPVLWPAVPGWKTFESKAIPSPDSSAVSSKGLRTALPSTAGSTLSFVIVTQYPTYEHSLGATTELGRIGDMVMRNEGGSTTLKIPRQGKFFVGKVVWTTSDRLPHEFDIVTQGTKRIVYVNGKLARIFPSKGPLAVDLHPTLNLFGIVATAQYSRALSPAEIRRNAVVARVFAESLYPDTKTLTLDLKVTALTPIPEPNLIKPYRSALVAQEYTVTRILEGHQKGLKPGTKVRIFRYGIFEGKKTSVQNQKVGDAARITVELLSSDPFMSREYQLDDLNIDPALNYYVELPGNAKTPSP